DVCVLKDLLAHLSAALSHSHRPHDGGAVRDRRLTIQDAGRHAAKGGADGPPTSLQFEGRPRVLGSGAEAKTRLLGAGGGGSVRVDRTCDHTPRTHGGAGGLSPAAYPDRLAHVLARTESANSDATGDAGAGRPRLRHQATERRRRARRGGIHVEL